MKVSKPSANDSQDGYTTVEMIGPDGQTHVSRSRSRLFIDGRDVTSADAKPTGHGQPTGPGATASASDAGAPAHRAAATASVSSPVSKPLAGALPEPLINRPALIRDLERSIDATTRRDVGRLVDAVNRQDWSGAAADARRIAERLEKAKPNELSADARDEMFTALSYGLKRAEEEDQWSFVEILLGILLLGIPALVDLAVTTDVERLGKTAAQARERESRGIAKELLQHRNGATETDEALLLEHIQKVPPAVLRTLQAMNVHVVALREGIFDGRF